jgi:hypothetical protein
MNLIDGLGDGEAFVSTDGWLRLPCRFRGSLTLGIRPADTGFAPRDGFVRVAEGVVTDCQRVEERYLVAVGDRNGGIRGLLDERPISVRMAVWVREDRIHWFDGTTGGRIAG